MGRGRDLQVKYSGLGRKRGEFYVNGRGCENFGSGRSISSLPRGVLLESRDDLYGWNYMKTMKIKGESLPRMGAPNGEK
jgi:hypothetical protein